MEQGDVVSVRFKRYFQSQKLWVFVGQIHQLTENWLEIEGRGILIDTGQSNPIDIDEESRVLVCPRENIAHIRILPDDYDFSRIETYRRNSRWLIKVEGAADACLAEQ